MSRPWAPNPPARRAWHRPEAWTAPTPGLAPGLARRLIVPAWIAAALLAIIPFLFVTIPPLADAPGHLGQFAIQAAAPDSALHSYFAFHWSLRLNLGTDLLVAGLRHLFGLEPATLIVCAAIPPLTVGAIVALARSGGRSGGRDAAAASFALPFAYAYPFNFGFLNYTLGMALALLAFALWLKLAQRPLLRELLFWPILPALMIVHAVGGGLLPVMILADRAARLIRGRRLPAPADLADGAIAIRPLLGILVVVLIAHGPSAGPLALDYTWSGKANAIVDGLRDQNRLLDIGSMVAALAAPLLGWWQGARYHRSGLAIVLALALLFLVTPAQISGSSYNDMRLVPPLAIAALTLQDWRRVRRAPARLILLGGFALFAARIAVTAHGFAGYARAYAAEAGALPHIARGTRVLALVTRDCTAARAWRTSRLDHFPVMATVEREAWMNALWDVPSIHLVQIRYRPSPDFFDDPSHYVWPAACVSAADPDRRTIAESAALLPLDRIDYLWLIQAKLPRGPWLARLTPVWAGQGSILYRVRARPDRSWSGAANRQATRPAALLSSPAA